MCRRFMLIRDDHDGVNEPGIVAEGIVFRSGKVAINWTTDPKSIQNFDSFADLMVVQAKNNVTRIQWLDASSKEPGQQIRPSGAVELRSYHAELKGMLGATAAVVQEEDHSVVLVIGPGSRG